MTTQYTPGPWVITYKTQSDYPHMYITHDSETRSQIIADLHCPVNIDAGGNTYSNMNKQANARLIAAAPDLLAALQSTLNVLAGIATGDLKTIERDSPAIAKARAAIAKAKGA